MKRSTILLFSSAILIPAVTWAGGFQGPGAQPVSSVEAALKASDDTPVVLEGRVVSRIKGDIYEFRDATGSMKVEVDDEDWPSQMVDPTNRVRLVGEVDRDLIGREIDVERVELLP